MLYRTHDDEGTPFPGHWQICGTCGGHGKHSRALGAFTSEDWERESYEFKEDYLNGAYDSQCEDCKGSGKVWEVNVARCSFGQKRELAKARQRAMWEAESRRDREHEMRMLGEF